MGTDAGLDNNGSDALGLGLNIGAEYFILDDISASASYTRFFRSSFNPIAGNEVSRSLNSINLDGRYYFIKSPTELYGIAGISIASTSVETRLTFFGVPQTTTSSDSEVGINLGVGANWSITDDLGANVQVIYNTPLEQPIFQIGVFYRIL